MDYPRDLTATMGAKRRCPASLLLFGAPAAACLLILPMLRRLITWGAPKVYAVGVMWLTPPYVYVVLNGIILTIAAASHFHKGGSGGGDPPELDIARKLHEVEIVSMSSYVEKQKYEEGPSTSTLSNYGEESKVVGSVGEDVKEEEGMSKMGRNVSVDTPPSSTDFSDKPPTTIPSKIAEASSGTLIMGNSAKVDATSRRSEEETSTLESTWKMITEGGGRRAVPLPLARPQHLKNEVPAPESWEVRDAKAAPEQSPTLEEEEYICCGKRRAPLRREPSPGQEEVNSRAEAFIQRFHQEMRLQRERSIQRYWDVIHGITRRRS